MHRYAVRMVGMGLGLLLVAQIAQAQEDFGSLLNRVPRNSNAVVLLNLEKALQSPLGQKEGWAQKVEKAFQAGVSRVPPQTTRFVLASQLEFETLTPMSEAAIIEINCEVSLPTVAEKRSGQMDKLGDLSAVALPNGVYLVQFGPNVFGAIAPANRQAAVRWLREISPSTVNSLSPYLQKAAGYSDNAGSEIIMAIDLSGAFGPERIAKYLSSKPWLQEFKVDCPQFGKTLGDVQGIRLGVRIGEPSYGKVTVDFAGDMEGMAPFAKRLLLEILTDAGAEIEDLNAWKPEVKGNTVSLGGNLSQEGLRRILSVVESPAPASDVTAEASPKPGTKTPDAAPDVATASREHFQKVTKYLRELKFDLKEVKSFASNATWFDRYASKIEKLPILNVDPEVVDYSAFVAQSFRQAAGSVKTAGINKAARSASVQTSPDMYAYYGGYSGYGAYGYARYAPRADVQYEGAQRRIIRTEERSKAAGNYQDLRSQVIEATNDTRRRMTQKYQIEF